METGCNCTEKRRAFVKRPNYRVEGEECSVCIEHVHFFLQGIQPKEKDLSGKRMDGVETKNLLTMRNAKDGFISFSRQFINILDGQFFCFCFCFFCSDMMQFKLDKKNKLESLNKSSKLFSQKPGFQKKFNL